MSFEPVLILRPETVETLKASLFAKFPSVGPSLRMEAVARAAGFNSYAAMRADGFNFQRQVSGSVFVAFLKDRGHEVEAIEFYRAIAHFGLQSVLPAMPDLTPNGLGHPDFHYKAKEWFAKSADEKRVAYSEKREEFRGEWELDGFLQSIAFLATVDKIKSNNPNAGSYGLKHLAERSVVTFPDGSPVGKRYVTNGCFIAAAKYLGFAVKPYSHKSPNATFNMSQKSLKR